MRPHAPDTTACSSIAQALLARLLEGDQRGAEVLILEARRQDPSAVFLYSTIVGPALRTVGRMWELAEISVADEHMATEITALSLDRLAPFRPPRDGPPVVLARPVLDGHELGERAIGAAFSDAGWAPAKLGAVDPEALARVVAARRPALVALSVKLPHHILDAVAQVQAVKALPDPPPVLVGGEGAHPLLTVHGADHVDDDLASGLAWAEACRRGAPA